jgi:hypothetical protein
MKCHAPDYCAQASSGGSPVGVSSGLEMEEG